MHDAATCEVCGPPMHTSAWRRGIERAVAASAVRADEPDPIEDFLAAWPSRPLEAAST